MLDTDEELTEWKNKFDERIAILESKTIKLGRELKDTEDKRNFNDEMIKENIKEIAKLQTAAEVIFIN